MKYKVRRTTLIRPEAHQQWVVYYISESNGIEYVQKFFSTREGARIWARTKSILSGEKYD